MNEIIEIAKKELGYKENPAGSNKTKYGEWFGLNGLPWCGIFVSWVYAVAQANLPAIGWPKGFASCQKAVDYFRSVGKVTKNPVEGDVVFFDWDGNGHFDHVGLFTNWIDDGTNGGFFHTIEGNTSLSNQSNGGEVMARRRQTKNVVFVHP